MIGIHHDAAPWVCPLFLLRLQWKQQPSQEVLVPWGALPHLGQFWSSQNIVFVNSVTKMCVLTQHHSKQAGAHLLTPTRTPATVMLSETGCGKINLRHTPFTS